MDKAPKKNSAHMGGELDGGELGSQSAEQLGEQHGQGMEPRATLLAKSVFGNPRKGELPPLEREEGHA